MYLCSEKLKYKELNLRLWKDNTKDIKCMAKKVQLSQILLNLLNNAIHAIENDDESLID